MAIRRDGVILLHGIGRRSGSMGRLECACRDSGYRTLNLDYPSRRSDLATLANHVHRASSDWVETLDGVVHFVTHSMGGLVARAFIMRYRPSRLGRVIMLGPPNQGSEIADLLEKTPPYRRIFGPAGAQLSTRALGASDHLFGPIDFQLGIIAGDRTLNPLSFLLLPKPNDGIVAVARTKLDGMAAHRVISTNHTIMMRDPGVIAETVTFLKTGHFAGSATI